MLGGQAYPAFDLFKDFLIVPDFQRDYVWEPKKAQRLLQDVMDFATDPFVSKEDNYFVGSIVLQKLDAEHYAIIDGQQRLTTIYLSIIAIRDHVLSLDPTRKVHVFNSRLLSYEEDTPELRLQLNDEDSRLLLTELTTKTDPKTTAQNKRRKQLKSAYDALRLWIEETFGYRIDDAFEFFNALKRISVLSYVATTNAEAVRVFQVLNARGKALNQAELVKSLLFKALPDTEYNALRTTWNKLVQHLDDVDEKPDRFLAYFLLAEYGIAERAANLHSWFESKEGVDKTNHKAAPLDFVRLLESRAKSFANFAKGRFDDGSVSFNLSNIAAFSKTARQHLMLMFAARKFSVSIQALLAERCEAILFFSQVKGEHTRENERRFRGWAQKVCELKTEEEVRLLVSSTIGAELAELVKEALPRLLSLQMEQNKRVSRERCEYVVARFASYADTLARNIGTDKVNVYDYIGKEGYELEHILPQKLKAKSLAEFGEQEEAELFVGKLGNLTYILKAQNGSFKNEPFSIKARHYEASDVIITRSLVGKVEGVNHGLTRAYELTSGWSNCNSDAISRRGVEIIRGLLRSFQLDLPSEIVDL